MDWSWFNELMYLMIAVCSVGILFALLALFLKHSEEKRKG